MTIVWDDELNLDQFGDQEPVVRQLIGRAIDAWNAVIIDFNYDGDDNPETNNILEVDIGAFPFLGGTRAFAGVTNYDASGKPTSAEIIMDVDGGGKGWFLDPTPIDDAEFAGGLVNPFMAVIADREEPDFFRSILHELGHAVGIESGSDLIKSHLTRVGTDQVDGRSHLQLFQNPDGPFGQDGFQVTFTTGATLPNLHIYEGPPDPAFPDVPIHPRDLLDHGRTVSNLPTARQLVSDIHAKILVDTYGYTVRLPSQINTFHVNLDTLTGQLFVEGGPDETMDNIRIRRSGDDLVIEVNETSESVPVDQVTSIHVDSGNGADTVTLDYAGGEIPIPPGGITLDGGSNDQANRLVFTGGTSDAVTYTPDSATSGQIVIDGLTIDYSGFDLLVDALAAGQRDFMFGEAASEITVSDNDQPDDGISRITNATMGLTTEFRNPSDSLTVTTGDGDDTIIFEALESNQFATVADIRGGVDAIQMRGGTIDTNFPGSTRLVLEAGESLSGQGLVRADVLVAEGARVDVNNGTLSVQSLLNDGFVTLSADSEISADSFDNAGGTLTADPSSMIVARGVVATGGLGEGKRFGGLTLSGAEVELNGAVDATGPVILLGAADVELAGALRAGSLMTELGTRLSIGNADVTVAGDVRLAEDSFQGNGVVTLLAGGELASANNTLHTVNIDHGQITTISGSTRIGAGGLSVVSGSLSAESDVEIQGPLVLSAGTSFLGPESASDIAISFGDQVQLEPAARLELMGPGTQVVTAAGGRLAVANGAEVIFDGGEVAPISLRSSSPGVAWHIEAEEVEDVFIRHTDVQDADASASASPVVALDSIDSGNNQNWLFADAATVISLDDDGNLRIDDIGRKSDRLRITTNGDNLIVEDLADLIDAQVGVELSDDRASIPQSLITGGQVIVQLGRGDDALTVAPRSGESIAAQLFINEKDHADDDELIVDLSDGGTILSLQFEAGAGENDTIQIIGDTDAQSALQLEPGAVDFNGTPVAFSGAESAALSNVRSATYVAPLAENVITLSRPSQDEISLTGTADSVPFTDFIFDDVDSISDISVSGSDGSEHLIVDYRNGLDPIRGRLRFDANGEPEGLEDVLEIRGGEFSRVRYEYTDASSGMIDLSGRFIQYTGVEPILNSAVSAQVILDLTAADDEAVLRSSDDGEISLISVNETFQSTTFPTPSLRITLSGGAEGDMVTVDDLAAAGFQGELRLFGDGGDDAFQLSPSSGRNIILRGASGDNLLTGLRGESLVFDGGSEVVVSDVTILDDSDGAPAVQIIDGATSVRLEDVTIIGNDDPLVGLSNGQGGGLPTLDLIDQSTTFRLEAGADNVAFVDNQTLPAGEIGSEINRVEFVTGVDTNRTIGLVSDGRTLSDVTSSASTHGAVVDNGDGTVTYAPDTGFTGDAEFRYSLSDGSTGTVHVEVLPPNQPPRNDVPGTQFIDEDMTLVFSAANGNDISINDDDANGDDVRVQLAVTHGALQLQRRGRTAVWGNGTGTVDLRGSVTGINDTLEGLMFVPDANLNGTVNLALTTNDLGNNGGGGALMAVDTIVIEVASLNDAPTIAPLEDQSTDEDVPIVFSKDNGNPLVVSDPDADPEGIEVVLRVGSGSLIPADVTGLQSDSGSGTNELTLVGPTAAIAAALDGLSYQPDLEFSGADQLSVEVNDFGRTGDGGAMSDTASIGLQVVAINDGPVNSVPGPQSTIEEQPITFSAATENLVSISDRDAGQNNLEVTISVDHGAMSLATTEDLAAVAGQGTAVVSLLGSTTAINAALDGMTYQPDDDFDGIEFFTIRTNDLGNTGAGGEQTNTAMVVIVVEGVNDAPQIELPAAQQTREDQPLVLGGDLANGVVILDADSGREDVETTLSVSDGTLTLPTQQDLTSVSGDGTASITLVGALLDINASIDGLTYTPRANFHGQDSLVVETSDQGHSGTGGSLESRGEISITVLSVNDAPLVEFSQTTIEVIQDAGPQLISNLVSVAAGPDDELNNQFVINVAIGSISNPTLFQNPPELDAAGNLRFTSAPDTFGEATVTVTATDSGGTENGGENVASESFEIVILSDNNPPTVVTPFPDVEVDEDADDTIIGNVGGFFADADNEPLTVAVSSSVPELVEATVDFNELRLAYQPDASGVATIEVRVSDAEVTTFTSFDVRVRSVNDAPVNIVPGPQSIVQDAKLTFSDENGNALAVQDIDAGLGEMEINLSVTRGVLSLDFSEGGNVIGDGTSSVTVNGPLLGVQDALKTVRFAPEDGFNGFVTLTLSSDDLGSTGAGGAMMDRDTVLITVGDAVNDAPQFVTPSDLVVSENLRDVVGVQAIDPNDDPLTFSLTGGADADLFEIDSISGQLSFRTGPDFESPVDVDQDNVYEVQVAVSDGIGESASRTFQVEVADVDESVVTVNIVAVSPSPRAGAVEQIVVQFNQSIQGLGLDDLSLSRTVDTQFDVPLDTATLTSEDGTTWVLANLNALTADSGIYDLTLRATESEITSSNGAALLDGASTGWTNGAGDVNADRQFDQLDLVTVLQPNKYLTDQVATWSEGDWNADGKFNQLDIIVAQLTQPSHYLAGPFGAQKPATVDQQVRSVMAQAERTEVAAVDLLFGQNG